MDVRIIAATNANLEQLIAEGKFREDLFYRLNVIPLKLPPLRERREEIPPLVQHYLRKFAAEQKKGQLTLADETLEYLLLYSWPGNVRQLANEVRRMVALADTDSVLTPPLLSPGIQASRRTIPASAAAAAPEQEVRIRLDQPLPVAVEMLEQTMIRSALARSRGRVETARRSCGRARVCAAAAGGSPYTDPKRLEQYAEQSPITYAPKVKAPTLILALTGDYRVPITQSYRFYHALRDNGVPVQFFAYPLPGHSPTDPVHQRDIDRRWVEWFRTHFDTPPTTLSSGR